MFKPTGHLILRGGDRIIQLHWYDWTGAVGDLLIIGSYLLLQMDRLKSSSLIYSLANGLGAALIIISLFYDFNLAAFIIEAFWVAISVYGLWKYFNRKKERAQSVP